MTEQRQRFVFEVKPLSCEWGEITPDSHHDLFAQLVARGLDRARFTNHCFDRPLFVVFTHRAEDDVEAIGYGSTMLKALDNAAPVHRYYKALPPP